ncbi:MAG: carbohydrate binding family 9 domain-containing protein, partial [Gemmatimonadales bacterium]
MILASLLLATMLGPDDPGIHNGRAGRVQVRPPRLAGAIVVDGNLDEAQWKQASILTGFSQYSPVDGVAAADSTEVLIWYSPTHLHIGVRAFAPSGTVRATLAQRDQIFSDDNLQVLLSTFNDGRQASVFAVNPFGVQADGAMNESGRGASCSGFNCATQTREGTDLSQDFVWESKGRLTPDGYEVEMRIPFKSIRFQQAKTQTWGINIVRVVQRSGQEQTWTMTKRGASSFLAQSGKLEGL